MHSQLTECILNEESCSLSGLLCLKLKCFGLLPKLCIANCLLLLQIAEAKQCIANLLSRSARTYSSSVSELFRSLLFINSFLWFLHGVFYELMGIHIRLQYILEKAKEKMAYDNSFTEEKIQRLFCNIEQILDFHRSLMLELSACVGNKGPSYDTQIAQCYLRQVSYYQNRIAVRGKLCTLVYIMLTEF